MTAYTGITTRLETYNEQEVYEEIKADSDLEYRQNGDYWIVYRPTVSRVQPPTQESGIPIPLGTAQANIERHANHKKTSTLNDALMPLILLCIIIMLFAAVGDYHSVKDIPRPLLILALFASISGYVSYRGSDLYQRGGDALEQFMHATHKTNGHVNWQVVRDRIYRK